MKKMGLVVAALGFFAGLADVEAMETEEGVVMLRSLNDLDAQRLPLSTKDLSYQGGTSLRTLVGFPLELPELVRLDLSYNSLDDLKVLPSLQKLEWLSLHDNGLKSLSGMPELPNLERLELDRNRLTSLDGMPYSFPKLTSLQLGYNCFRNLDGLNEREFPALESLGIFGNHLTKTALLSIHWENFPKLESVALPDLKYSDADKYEIQRAIESKLHRKIGGIYWIDTDGDSSWVRYSDYSNVGYSNVYP